MFHSERGRLQTNNRFIDGISLIYKIDEKPRLLMQKIWPIAKLLKCACHFFFGSIRCKLVYNFIRDSFNVACSRRIPQNVCSCSVYQELTSKCTVQLILDYKLAAWIEGQSKEENHERRKESLTSHLHNSPTPNKEKMKENFFKNNKINSSSKSIILLTSFDPKLLQD